ncbi:MULTISPECIES: sugar ABC transporter substrate-binding protein [Paracoccus]|jgi:simple sugar transport system substrate-binding protein|uniref:sugar ABC transporter substrate-binding protein n=1 Tax=Paracoccus TaxID=265 RepID=UPI0005E31E35|nr:MULTISPECIES: sugar ABC transporter substrate-binding protein [Paracoccus]KIX16521.1 LacI family transcriptional regulator [Paracoccus sp. 228]QXI65422.1 Ribose import binding protein RbsB [Paracoccus marcusii]|tara:strand:+ start:67 stop:990 length:924 start_codon:yes stop_codon:yes gene_type:complete
MTKLTASAAVTALLALAAPAMAQNIIVVAHGQANDPFWSVVKNGAAKAGEHTGATVDFRSPEVFDMVAMGQLIDAAVNQQPDGLVVSIPDADALGPSIQRAVEAGIPVISMNSGSDVAADLGALLHVGQSEYDAGVAAGQRLAEMGGTKGICVNQEVGNVSLDQRCDGFAEGFGHPVTVVPTANDPTEVQSKVRAALESDPEVDTVLGLGASLVGEPAVAAAEALGRDDVMIASFDLSAGFLQAVADGKAAFAIDQQQFLQGYLPVAFLALNAQYGLMPGGDVPSGPNLVTQDSAAQVIELSAQGIR